MNAGHERRDVDVVSLFALAVALFLSGALICGGIWGLMRFLTAKERAHDVSVRAASTNMAGAFPPPRLEAQSSTALEQLRTNEDAFLNSYGWVDRTAGTARIPIDRAMRLIIERGLPDVGAGQTPLQLMQSRPQQNALAPGGAPQ